MNLKIILVCLFIIFANAYAMNDDTYPFTSKEDAARFTTLTQELRCVVCQNQNIADSNSPLASDMRQKIYRMILEKKSDIEIKNYLVTRYSEFILFKPPFNTTTFILWLAPFIGVFFIFLLLYFFQ